MKWLKKWLRNWDSLMAVLGAALIYFSEDIVMFLMPLEPLPSGVISILIYMTIYSVAAFFLFNSVAYFAIKLYWSVFYDYFESQFKRDFADLTKFQRVCVTSGFYLSLFFILALIFLATVGTL